MANFTNRAVRVPVTILDDGNGRAALSLPTTSANVPASTQYGAIRKDNLTNYYKQPGVAVATDGKTTAYQAPVVALPESVPATGAAKQNFKPTYVENTRKPATTTTTTTTGGTGGQTAGATNSNISGYQAQLGDLYNTVMGYKPYQSDVDLSGAQGLVNDAYNAMTNYAPYEGKVDLAGAADTLAGLAGAVTGYAPYQSTVDFTGAENELANIYGQIANYGPYQSKYDGKTNAALGKLEQVLGQIENYGEFKYDLNADMLYKQMADRYVQQGKQAMRDAMGQAAAMTGGYGNSYASQVGNQAYQQHLTALNDQIPELQAQALNVWQSGLDQLTNLYGLTSNQLANLMNLDAADYAKYMDAYNRLTNQYSLANNQYSNLLNKEQTNYSRWQDGYNQAVSNYNVGQSQYQNALNQDQIDYGRYTDDFNKLVTGFDASNTLYGNAVQQDQIDYGRWQDGYNQAVGNYELGANHVSNMLGLDEAAKAASSTGATSTKATENTGLSVSDYLALLAGNTTASTDPGTYTYSDYLQKVLGSM